MAYVILPRESRPFSFLHPAMGEAKTHPTVTAFLQLDTEQIIHRYCKEHKDVQQEALWKLLTYRPKHFRWAGADLFPGVTAAGRPEMVVLEVNSCPSGQKYMPHGGTGMDSGYHKLMGETFRDTVSSKCDPFLRNKPLAVVLDKNQLETSGYAAALADITKEPVYVVEAYLNQPKEHNIRWTDGIMEVRDVEDQWHAIRAAFRYVTQKPWTRIPLTTKTVVFNHIASDLSGGRNKLLAAVAYEDFNKQQGGTGLRIRTPRTFLRVTKAQIPTAVQALGGKAVIKVPYSNSGQGVYTVTSQKELDELMAQDLRYEKFIVQALVGHKNWSSSQWHHACTLPDEEGRKYVFDTRLMVHATPDGFRPLCIFSRRAHLPLPDTLDGTEDSWEFLGTNLTVKDTVGDSKSDTERLLSVDNKPFEMLNLNVDNLVDGFVQTVMATIAIDKMCCRLVRPDNSFDFEEFVVLGEEGKILEEIYDLSDTTDRS
ncbi:uncharacterized protein LOC118417736 isoform X3 [Branchiostoma floridae]|uniref:Uncharacterized protein LOC118417736 isoform X3 n=2 Tax=Branchiostoma floridae TaxID=7739 RepID=A0A9J7LCQ3_BRAFL|nr:uncharacterized protein LOC118417736 isoform X3 [Branchiostoma floridae]